MSTRGYVGFYKNKKDIGGYNHHDSYPDGLGKEIFKFLKGKSIKELNDICDSLNDKEEEGDVWNWKDNTFNKKFKNLSSFLYDSLFCEYAYIINLDDNTLELYEGFNKDADAPGRYAKYFEKNDGGYYGVKLVRTISLKTLKNCV